VESNSGETSEEGSDVRNPQVIPRPYLCTGFDAYVTREPCAMYVLLEIFLFINQKQLDVGPLLRWYPIWDDGGFSFFTTFAAVNSYGRAV
jgi:hypothetical protein